MMLNIYFFGLLIYFFSGSKSDSLLRNLNPQTPLHEETTSPPRKPIPVGLLLSKSSELYEEATRIRNADYDYTGRTERSTRTTKKLSDLVNIMKIVHEDDLEAELSREVLERCFLPESDCDERQKYRSYSGRCNNLEYPEKGGSFTELGRILPSEYNDRVSMPRSRSFILGQPLPNPRYVSEKLHERLDSPDREFSLMLMQWGQFIDHDMSLTPKYNGRDHNPLECGACDSARHHRACTPILIPSLDKFFPKSENKRCMKFTRSLPGQQRIGPRQQLNALSHNIDGGMLYGNNLCQAEKLREPNSYRLKVSKNPASAPGKPMKDLLPVTTENPECKSSDKTCFLAGDPRVNEQPGLTMLHTLFVREHNEIAASLAEINPHWDHETVFQETRRIVVATLQHITYSEFLPRVLNLETRDKYGLVLKEDGYYNEYTGQCYAEITNEFTTAAFRFGHSTVRANLTLMSEADMDTGKGLKVPLRTSFENPKLLKTGLVVDSLVRGFIMEKMEEMDSKITGEITDHLFEKKGQRFTGLDLAALNIQRGRDHGLPSYNKYRQPCGMLRAADFTHFLAEISPAFVEKLNNLYRDPNDVDLFPAMLVEKPLPGGIVGPTLSCLLGQQFNNLRQCDRFWYETGDPNLRFTESQLKEIRKVSLSAFLCRNCDEPGKVTQHALDVMDPVSNPIKHCSDLHHLDLTKWKEF